jgi:hypothetical protein
MELLRRIEKYLRKSGISASRFGRDAMSDPAFVHGLRAGREPRSRTVKRVGDYLDRMEA